MSDIAPIDVDSEEWENTPKALRDQVKKLQKANGELTQTITEFRTEKVETALTGVLAGFKNPGRVKSDLLSDGVDPLDTEAVATWLGTNGDDYARGENAATAPEGDQQEDLQAGRARLEAVAQIGTPGASNTLDVINSMPQDLSPTQAREWLIQHGA